MFAGNRAVISYFLFILINLSITVACSYSARTREGVQLAFEELVEKVGNNLYNAMCCSKNYFYITSLTGGFFFVGVWELILYPSGHLN